MSGTTVQRRLPRAERERQILDVAEREFGRHGFAAASMEQIANGSGITKALVYQYFSSKEGVYVACVERGRARVFQNLQEAAAAAAATRRQQLAAIIDSYFDQLDARRNSWYVLYGDAPAGAVDEMRQRNAKVIADLLRTATPLDEPDVELAAQLIVGAGEQVGRWWLEHREMSAEQVKARFTIAIGAAITALGRG